MHDMSRLRSHFAYVLLAGALPLAVASTVLAWADESLAIALGWMVTAAAWCVLTVVQARRMRTGRKPQQSARHHRATIVLRWAWLIGSGAAFGLFVVALAQHWAIYLALRLLYLALITLAEFFVSFRPANRPNCPGKRR